MTPKPKYNEYIIEKEMDEKEMDEKKQEIKE